MQLNNASNAPLQTIPTNSYNKNNLSFYDPLHAFFMGSDSTNFVDMESEYGAVGALDASLLLDNQVLSECIRNIGSSPNSNTSSSSSSNATNSFSAPMLLNSHNESLGRESNAYFGSMWSNSLPTLSEKLALSSAPTSCTPSSSFTSSPHKPSETTVCENCCRTTTAAGHKHQHLPIGSPPQQQKQFGGCAIAASSPNLRHFTAQTNLHQQMPLINPSIPPIQPSASATSSQVLASLIQFQQQQMQDPKIPPSHHLSQPPTQLPSASTMHQPPPSFFPTKPTNTFLRPPTNSLPTNPPTTTIITSSIPSSSSTSNSQTTSTSAVASAAPSVVVMGTPGVANTSTTTTNNNSTSSSSSGSSAKIYSFCTFCKNNGESEAIYGTHFLKDSQGVVTCPILRAYTCPICGQNGDKAHTVKYCPVAARFAPKDAPVRSEMRVLRTARTSAGKRRFF